MVGEDNFFSDANAVDVAPQDDFFSDANAVDDTVKKKTISQPVTQPLENSGTGSVSEVQSSSGTGQFDPTQFAAPPKQPVVRNPINQYSEMQKEAVLSGQDYIAPQEMMGAVSAREYEKSQKELIGAQKGLEGALDADYNAKNSVYADVRSNAGKRSQDAAVLLGHAQFKADENISKLKDAIKPDLEYVGSNLENFTRKSQEEDVIADEVKIDEYAKEQARKKGLPEDGYYKNFLYNNAKAEVAQKIIEPDVLKEREKLFKEKTGKSIDAAFGEDFAKGFTKAQEIEQTAKTQVNLVAQEVNSLAKVETEEVAKGVNSQIEQLNAAYQQQASQVTDQAQADALHQEYTSNFNKLQANFLDAQNQINGKYNQRLRRQADEIEKVATQKWAEEAEKYKKEYKASPELLAQLKDVSQEAYKKVVGSNEKIKEARDYSVPALNNYYRSTVSSLGRSLGNLSETVGYDYGKVLGDYMENTYQPGSAELNSWKDLLDASKLAKSAGQLTGAMLPSMTAAAATTIATEGMGAPAAVSMLAGGLAAWTGESMDMAGNIERETFAETGDANKALERSKRMWDAQIAIMPLYALEALPFMKGLSLGKNVGKRMAGGAVAEYVPEVMQEYTQTKAEEVINKDKEFSQIFDNASWKEFGHTALNVAPVILLGAGGQIKGEASEKEKAETDAKKFAKTYALKEEFTELAPDQRDQFLSGMLQSKGVNFTSAFISNLYTNGHISKSSANELTKSMGIALEVQNKAKEYGLDQSQQQVFTAFKYKLDAAQRRLAEETDPILKQVAEQRVKELEEQTVNFASGKQADYVVLTYPNNEQYVLSLSQAQNAAKNPKLIQSIQSGDMKVDGVGKGVDVVNGIAEGIKAEKKAKVDAEKAGLVAETRSFIEDRIATQNANYDLKAKQDKEAAAIAPEPLVETPQDVAGVPDEAIKADTRETKPAPAIQEAEVKKGGVGVGGDVELKYNDKGEHLAPNGQPSKLSELQSKHIRLKAFKDKYGDWEKGQDATNIWLDKTTGEPLRVYHGSKGNKKFDRFEKTSDIGFHFSPNKSIASDFAKNEKASQRATEEGEFYEPVMYEGFINTKDIEGIEDLELWTVSDFRKYLNEQAKERKINWEYDARKDRIQNTRDLYSKIDGANANFKALQYFNEYEGRYAKGSKFSYILFNDTDFIRADKETLEQSLKETPKAETKTNEEKTPTQDTPTKSDKQQPSKGQAKGSVPTTQEPVRVGKKKGSKKRKGVRAAFPKELKGFEPTNLRDAIKVWILGGGRLNKTEFAKQITATHTQEYKESEWMRREDIKENSADLIAINQFEEWINSGLDEQSVINEIYDVAATYAHKNGIEQLRKELLESKDAKDYLEANGMSREDAAAMEAYYKEIDELEKAKQEYYSELTPEEVRLLNEAEPEMTDEIIRAIHAEEITQANIDTKLKQIQNENNDGTEKGTAESSTTETVGVSKAKKEYEAELSDLTQKLKEAEKAKRDKLDRISGKVDLFADEAKSNELFGAEQNLSAENIAKQLQPETDKIAKLEAEKAAFEANKENYLKKYDKQSEISEEKPLTEKEKAQSKTGKTIADAIRKFADKIEVKFYDEDGNEIKLTKSGTGLSEKDILYKIADLVEKGGELIDHIRAVLNEQDWYKNLTDKGKEAVEKQIAEKMEEGEKKDGGEKEKKIVGRAHKGDHTSEEVKVILERIGLTREVKSIEEAIRLADEILDSLSEVDILNSIKRGGEEGIDESEAAIVIGRMIDRAHNEYKAAETQREKEILAEKEAAYLDLLDELGVKSGRFIGALGKVYQMSPLGYKKYARKKIQNANNAALEKVQKQLDELKKQVDKTQDEAADLLEQNIELQMKLDALQGKKSKSVLSPEKAQRKAELRAKGFGSRYNDITTFMTLLADKEAMEYIGLAFEEAKGDFKAFAKDVINNVGKKLKEHVPALWRKMGGKESDIILSEKQVEKDVRSAIEQLYGENAGKKLTQLAKEYYKAGKEVKGELVDFLVEKTGLTKLEVAPYAKAIEEVYDKILNKRVLNALEQTFPLPKLNKAKAKKEYERIVQAINIGLKSGKRKDGSPFDFTKEFYNKFGLVDVSEPDVVKQLDAFADKIYESRNEKNSLYRDMATIELLDWIANRQLENRLISGVVEQIYANMLYGEDTHFRNTWYNTQVVLGALAEQMASNPKQAYTILKAFGQNMDRGYAEMVNTLITGMPKSGAEVKARGFGERAAKINGFLRVWSAYVNKPGRALQGMDSLLNFPTRKSNIAKLLIEDLKKKNPNLSPREISAQVNQFLYGTDVQQNEWRAEAEKQTQKYYGLSEPMFIDGNRNPVYADKKHNEAYRNYKRSFYNLQDNNIEDVSIFDEAKQYADEKFLLNTPKGYFGGVAKLLGVFGEMLPLGKATVTPFINVPLNIAAHLLEYSPLGAITIASGREGALIPLQVAKKYGIDVEISEKRRQQLITRAVLGSVGMIGVLALTRLKYDDDDEGERPVLIVTANGTGNYFKNKKLEKLSGSKKFEEYTVDFMGAKMSYKTSPFASFFLPAGFIMDAERYGSDGTGGTVDVTEKIAKSATGFMYYMGDQSSLSGISDILNFGERSQFSKQTTKEKLSESATKLVAKSIRNLTTPNFIPQTYRHVKGVLDLEESTGKGFLNVLAKDIPFADQFVDKKYDHFGKPINSRWKIPGIYNEPQNDDKQYQLAADKKYIDKLNYFRQTSVELANAEHPLTSDETELIGEKRARAAGVWAEKYYNRLKTLDNAGYAKAMNTIFNEAKKAAISEVVNSPYTPMDRNNMKEELVLADKKIEAEILELQHPLPQAPEAPAMPTDIEIKMNEAKINYLKNKFEK